MWTRITLTVALLALVGVNADASSLRTFVSSTGSDANPCTRLAPCATFAGALANTFVNGEIYAIDSADYSTSGGITTISKPVSIVGSGARAGISGNLNITTGGQVLLKRIDLNGQAGPGITVTVAGSNLVVDDCKIVNTLQGIFFSPTGTIPSYLVVRNSVISNATVTTISAPSAGVLLEGTSTGVVYATLDNVMLNNDWHGVYALDYTNVTIRDSNLTQNSHSGLRAESQTGGPVNAVVERSQASHNVGNGILAVGTGASITISGVTITDNGNGIFYLTGGVVVSFGNNSVSGNVASLPPSTTIALQ